MPTKIRHDSILLWIQTGCETQPVSYSMGTKAVSSRVQSLKREIEHSPSSSAEFGKSGAMPPLPIWFADGQVNFTLLHEIKETLGRTKSRWEDNIKMDFQEIG
jgi:hypothetical protein